MYRLLFRSRALGSQVLLGLGFATLVAPESDAACVQVSAVGVRISGLMFEAFYRPLPATGPGPGALLRMGCEAPAGASSPSAWSFVHDCFARVGGQEAMKPRKTWGKQQTAGKK